MRFFSRRAVRIPFTTMKSIKFLKYFLITQNSHVKVVMLHRPMLSEMVCRDYDNNGFKINFLIFEKDESVFLT